MDKSLAGRLKNEIRVPVRKAEGELGVQRKLSAKGSRIRGGVSNPLVGGLRFEATTPTSPLLLLPCVTDEWQGIETEEKEKRVTLDGRKPFWFLDEASPGVPKRVGKKENGSIRGSRDATNENERKERRTRVADLQVVEKDEVEKREGGGGGGGGEGGRGGGSVGLPRKRGYDDDYDDYDDYDDDDDDDDDNDDDDDDEDERSPLRRRTYVRSCVAIMQEARYYPFYTHHVTISRHHCVQLKNDWRHRSYSKIIACKDGGQRY
ncbi:hypothetical protein HZH66_009271 [Vespula vulgaris]|uniref:Uncharacterized protein n=1 Tax=Vespula vulgaris TaxID=7454 RepID=A0A834JNM0_VESVU|nr:hypothetical protein HZH66_009271 [Vespula vulgaris]